MITRIQRADSVFYTQLKKPIKHTNYYNFVSDSVSFKGKADNKNDKKYINAQKYADSLSKKDIYNLNSRQIEKLEGLQDGVKVFDGLSFKQVYFLMTNLKNAQFALIRGCAGMCPACCVNGRPHDSNLENGIKKVDFEDYKNLTDGMKQIAERLHFDYAEFIETKYFYELFCRDEKLLFALFFDSDCKDISLKDKDGNVHEFPELNKMMYDTIKVEGLFDTAGWAPENKKMNERMESLARYYADPQHSNEILQVNLSFNTYHGLYEKALEYKKAGNIEGYERMKKRYTDLIANAMYCFTPLAGTSKFKVFTKGMPPYESSEYDDYKTDKLKEMEQDVFKALEERYNRDLEQKNHKYVSSSEDVKNVMAMQKECILKYTTKILPSTRKNIFAKLHEDEISYLKDKSCVGFDEALKRYGKCFVDLNGQVYVFNALETAKTDIKLNFKNKDKLTDDIYPIPDTRILDVENETYK